MSLTCLIDNASAYAYTGGREPIPGQPWIVFVHGAQNDHSVWGLQSRWFAHHGWNVLAVDLPGHGRSQGPSRTSIEAYADWLRDVLNQHNIETPALVGHSMGSLIALELAGREDFDARALVMIGTAWPMQVSPALLQAARETPLQAIDMITAWSHSGWAQKPQSPGPGAYLNWGARRLMQRVLAQHGPDVLPNDFAACHTWTAAPQRAAQVHCPVSLVVGEADIMTPPKSARTLAEAFAACTWHRISGAGHALMAEAPAAVLSAIRASVQGQSRGA